MTFPLTYFDKFAKRKNWMHCKIWQILRRESAARLDSEQYLKGIITWYLVSWYCAKYEKVTTWYPQVCEILQGLFSPPLPVVSLKWENVKKKGKMGQWWKQWWLFCSPAKQYANRSLRTRSVCVDGNVVLWEIFEIVLQEISGFKIFSPRLLLALSLSNFPNLIW